MNSPFSFVPTKRGWFELMGLFFIFTFVGNQKKKESWATKRIRQYALELPVSPNQQ
jgi:hypothetical protein